MRLQTSNIAHKHSYKISFSISFPHHFARKARAVGKSEAKDVHALRQAAPVKAYARAAY